MKDKITDQPLEATFNVSSNAVELELRTLALEESHANAALLNKIRGAYMKVCGSPDDNVMSTSELTKPKALVACAMKWKNEGIKMPLRAMLKDKVLGAVLKSALTEGEMATMKAYLNTLASDDDISLPKAAKAMMTFSQGTEETSDWRKVKSPDREELVEAKTKKEWEKIDKKELDKDTKKEKEEHEKDAVKDDDSKIKKLKKGKPSEKKDVEIHDLKKDQELDKEDKIKYTKADSDKDRHEDLDDEEDREDEDSLKNEDKKEKKKHYKDAVKEDKKEIKDLKKDVKEDKKSAKESKAADYSEYWEEYAAERFGGKKRSKLKDSDFLDPKNRSFPVMSCKNVKAAVSTWGMYKGPMSFETFKSKLKSRAKKLGCESSLPKSWEDE